MAPGKRGSEAGPDLVDGPEERGTSEGYTCDGCGQPFKNAQGLAGHRRLAHSASTRSQLEERADELSERENAARRQETEAAQLTAAARRREAEAAERQRELDQTGPAALGMSQCSDCHAWFDSAEIRRAHSRALHPLEGKVAGVVGSSRSRVSEVWIEACYKQQRHPDKSEEQIVERFWSETDRKILRALLARNATFRFSKEVD